MDLFRSFLNVRPAAQIDTLPSVPQKDEDAISTTAEVDIGSTTSKVAVSSPQKSLSASNSFLAGMSEHVVHEPIPIEQALAAYRSSPAAKQPKPAVQHEQEKRLPTLHPVSPSTAIGSKDGNSTYQPEEPVPLSLPSSAENVSLVYQLCTNRNVTPVFDFGEPKPDFTWGCTLTIHTKSSIATIANIPTEETKDSAGPGKEVWESWDAENSTGCITIRDTAAYASKKMAKEHVSAMAIPILRCLPQVTKTAKSPNASAMPSPELEENWIGMLLEYCNAEGIPQASYQEFKQGQQSFSCELHVQNTDGRTFGGRKLLYPNKKTARALSARDAIMWLKDSGQYQKTMERQKKKNASKARKPSTSPMPATHTAKKQKQNPASPLSSHNSSVVAHDAPAATNLATIAAPALEPRIPCSVKVKTLCRELNIAEPRYRTTPNPDAPSLFSCHAVFLSDKDRALLRFSNLPRTAYDDIGVRDVKVRDVAREECARVLLGVLQDVRDNITLAKAHELNISPPPVATAIAEAPARDQAAEDNVQQAQGIKSEA